MKYAWLLLCLAACARSPAVPADVAAHVNAADTADDTANALDLAEVASACEASYERCEGACIPLCSLASVRLADACRCIDPTLVAPPQGPPMGQRLGLSVNVPQGTDDKAKAYRAWMWQATKDLGIQVVRHDLRWDHVEPQKGQFIWAATDDTVQALQAHGLRSVGVLAYGNPWASQAGKTHADPMYPPDDPNDFANFAVQVAKRYHGKIDDWEIWNEQNAGYRFWKNDAGVSGIPKDYALLLKATGDAIHKQVPGARVAFGGLFYLPQVILGAEAFTTEAFAAVPDLASAIDAFAYHPYSLYPPMKSPEFSTAEDSPGFHHIAVDQSAQRLRTLLQQQTGHAVPLWITELGWPVTEDSNSPADVARYLLRSWVLAASEGVTVLCWYTLMDQNPANDNVPWEKTFGLFAYDGDVTDGTLPQPHPAALALRGMARVLGELGFSADERAYSTARRQYAFTNAERNRVVHVLWDETAVPGQTVPAQFVARPGRSYRQADALDPPEAVTAWAALLPDAQGLLHVGVGATPVYVEELP